MKRLYILCEGQTEDDFVNIILSPHLQTIGVAAIPIICETKRVAGKKFKGGVSTFGKIKRDLLRLCGEHPNEMVTTMFDLYALPQDTPGIGVAISDVYAKVEHIEKAIYSNIGDRFNNLYINLVLHEFEGLLFSKVDAFESIADNSALTALQLVRTTVQTPEHINDSKETAPSKRIENILPRFSKVRDGVAIAEQIGIERITSECRHFADWLSKLTAWAKEGA